MTCEEFELGLPEIDNRPTVDQESHLIRCSSCSDLVADLKAISQQARLLQSSDEPNPRVWNSIELALREEGLIRNPGEAWGSGPKPQPFLVHVRPKRRRLAWSIPLAIAALLIFGVMRERRTSMPNSQVAMSMTPDVTVERFAGTDSADDRQLLQVVSRRSPAMLASYEADLRNVNSYIRDAEETVKINPNDEQAQRYLMNAYEERSMVYEMALDRSLP